MSSGSQKPIQAFEIFDQGQVDPSGAFYGDPLLVYASTVRLGSKWLPGIKQ